MGPNQLEKYVQQRLNFIAGYGCDVGGGLGYAMTITETTVITHCEVSLRNDEDEPVRTTIVFDPPYRMQGGIEYRLVFHQGKYRLYEMNDDGTIMWEAPRERPENQAIDEFFDQLDADIARQHDIRPANHLEQVLREMNPEERQRVTDNVNEFLQGMRNRGPIYDWQDPNQR